MGIMDEILDASASCAADVNRMNAGTEIVRGDNATVASHTPARPVRLLTLLGATPGSRSTVN